MKTLIIILLATLTALFIGCGGGESTSSRGTECENILSETPSTVPDMSIGTTYSSLHHSYLTGTIIKGTYENEPYSVTLTCNHIHALQLGNSSQVIGSYVIDYDSNNVPTLFLYDKASTGRHTISFDGTDLKTNASKFDGTGTVESIERTEKCEKESFASDEGFICSDNGNGYLLCSYKFPLTPQPSNGEIQQKAFHYDLPSAGELTIELNRWGAHVNLTDGAEELLNFARTDDYCEGRNTESTLLIGDNEIPYQELAPDTEVRDLLMTNMPGNPVSVQLKSGIGIAPNNDAYCPIGHYETEHTPFFDGCYGCYGNHCLNHYIPANMGQFQNTYIQFKFYAPKAKEPCKGSISEGENTWMESNTNAGQGGSALPPEGKPDPGTNNGNDNNETTWYLKYSANSSAFGNGTMTVKNFTYKCEGGSSDLFGKTCSTVNTDTPNTSIAYGGELAKDSLLIPLSIFENGLQINAYYPQFDWRGFVNFDQASGTTDIGNISGCWGVWKDSYTKNLQSATAFTISIDGTNGSCSLEFKPCTQALCQ